MKRGRRLSAAPFLLELSIAVLVFALAASVILMLFGAAHKKSTDAAALSHAVMVASTAADYLRAGDEAGFCAAFGAKETPTGFTAAGTLCPGEKAERPFALFVEKQVTGSLFAYSVTLEDEAGNVLAALSASWAKGGGA